MFVVVYLEEGTREGMPCVIDRDGMLWKSGSYPVALFESRESARQAVRRTRKYGRESELAWVKDTGFDVRSVPSESIGKRGGKPTRLYWRDVRLSAAAVK